jgi:hypothetical protein
VKSSQFGERRALLVGIRENLLPRRHGRRQPLEPEPPDQVVQRRTVHPEVPCPLPHIRAMTVRLGKGSHLGGLQAPRSAQNSSGFYRPTPPVNRQFAEVSGVR